MKKISRHFFMMTLSLVMLVGVLFVGNAVNADAATRKGYVIGQSNVRVYSNSELTVGFGWIYPTDEVSVITVTDRYSRVSYPVANGRYKTGYIATGNILTATTGTNYTSSGKFTTYRRDNTANSYGYVSANDSVLVLGARGSFTQIKYPVQGGYKYAFAKTSDVNTYLKNGAGLIDVDIRAGYFQIKSAINQRYVLDVYGESQYDGGNVGLYENNKVANQGFIIKKLSNGYYIIQAIHSGKVLDVEGCQTNVIQYTYSGDANQLWRITKDGSGYYHFQSLCNGKYLDADGARAANDVNIQVCNKNDTYAQKFVLEEVTLEGKHYVDSYSNSDKITQIVNYEISQIGVSDYRGNNNVECNRWYYGYTIRRAGYAWCQTFQSFAAYKCGVVGTAIPKTASCSTAVSWYKRKGLFHLSAYYGGNYVPKAGDLVYYGKGGSAHVGMIIASPVNGYLQVIEGNVYNSATKNYSVQRFTRNKKRCLSNSYVYGYASPDY